MQYEMDPGNAINENQLGEEERQTERDTPSVFNSFQSLAGYSFKHFFYYKKRGKEDVLDEFAGMKLFYINSAVRI